MNDISNLLSGADYIVIYEYTMVVLWCCRLLRLRMITQIQVTVLGDHPRCQFLVLRLVRLIPGECSGLLLQRLLHSENGLVSELKTFLRYDTL